MYLNISLTKVIINLKGKKVRQDYKRSFRNEYPPTLYKNQSEDRSALTNKKKKVPIKTVECRHANDIVP